MSRPGFKSSLSGWKPQFSFSLNRHEWNSCPSRLFFLGRCFVSGKLSSQMSKSRRSSLSREASLIQPWLRKN